MVKKFYYKTKIYYEDTDAGGIVYYANYLKYFERARTEWIYSFGFDHKKLNKINTFIVVRYCHVDYKKPVRFEDVIEIMSEISKISPVRINLIQSAKVSSETRVEAEVELAIVDSDGKPKKMPEDLYKSFKGCM
ncbi:MAG: 4-hydroxybenzoyl-CoA thioesterase [Candidatus Pelagibacter sp.]|nr:4-hydroxybenzoyl-CoA thioesterase [Candidatus Pelagibacter sp.]MAK12200.1 4-hydroxybenzoyl-CoA thioesterase [Candidatus Pelagibacter sp.]|tara:strand:- start:12 stop:413 length:402 start_codon:yes stop_codon:yes gene_type:complete